jgi:hypothetical protein
MINTAEFTLIRRRCGVPLVAALMIVLVLNLLFALAVPSSARETDGRAMAVRSENALAGRTASSQSSIDFWR